MKEKIKKAIIKSSIIGHTDLEDLTKEIIKITESECKKVFKTTKNKCIDLYYNYPDKDTDELIRGITYSEVKPVD